MMKGKNRENVSNSSMVMTGMVVLLVSLAFMLLATPAAAQPVEVWVNAPEYVAEGATFEVTIDVDDLTNFNCGMFDLSFDSNVVVVTDVEEGRLDEKIIPAGLWKFMDKNTIRVFLEISGVSVVSGSGYLAKISFQAVGEEGDESVLDLSKGELICFNLVEEIPAWWIAAEVRIVKGEPTPTPPADRVHNLNTSENFSFIQAAIDDPDTKEGHIIEVADGIYYENVKVTKCLTIRSENGSTNCIVLAAKANDNVFEITADYACIRGFTVKGALAKGKAGIYLNASHCCVSNNNCSDNHYGIRLEGAHNNSISNNGCYTNTWDGISLGYSSKNRISKNNCSHNHFGYDIHLNDSNNNNISNNICTANKWEGGFHLSYSNNNNISNNDCLYNNDDGIYLSYSNNNCISNNNCTNNDDGIYLRGSNNNSISNNNCTNNDDDGIHLRDSNNNSISNNNCSNNKDDGVCLEGANSNCISNNNCYNNENGIHLEDSNNNCILNSNCTNNEDDGIHLRDSNNNSISNNNCSNNEAEGFHLRDSNNNCISNSICTNNEDDGIYLRDSNNNHISNNNCFNSSDGIWLRDSNNNSISNNNCSSNNRYSIFSEGDGIHLFDSNNNSISNNNCTNNEDDGIHLGKSNNNIISKNNCSNNGAGIFCWFSNSNHLTGNVMVENGIQIEGDSLSDYKHEIDGSNTVNGKPVYYWKDREGGRIPDGAGLIILVNCSNVIVENQNLNNASIGIEVAFSSFITIKHNNLNNVFGILLKYSNNNSIASNNCSNDEDGIYLWNSKNSKLTGNLMLDNGIVIIGNSLCDYTHEIDESNTVNGKPVYYWKDKEGGRIPDGAGQVILVNCSNIVVENQNLNNASVGIEAAFSSCISIENNTCSSNNEVGIRLYNSSVNSISKNNCSNTGVVGILFYNSSINSISKNNCSSNKLGIYLSGDSNNNLIYFNNFVNNTANVFSFGDTNIWNSWEKITYTYNGRTYTHYLGNYWSDYRGKDTNKDGIGDTPYSTGWWEKDSYPLMLPFENYFVSAENISDTRALENPYPSISDLHNGTIVLS